MLNIFKMDFYHLFKSKTLYVVGAIMTFYCIIEVILFTVLPDAVNVGFGDEGMIGSLFRPSSFTIFMQYVTLTSGGPLIFMGTFWALFMNSDYSQGFIKNIAGQVPKREYMVFSKYIVMLIYVLIMYVWSFIISNIACLIVSKNIKFAFNVRDFFAVLFMYIGFMSLFFLFTYLLRKSFGAIVVIFLISLGVFSLGAQALDLLIKYLFDKIVMVEKITLSYHFQNYMTRSTMGLNIGTITGGMIIASVFIIVSIALSLVAFKKRDIVV